MAKVKVWLTSVPAARWSAIQAAMSQRDDLIPKSPSETDYLEQTMEAEPPGATSFPRTPIP